jgi:hypothetical protein
MTINSTTAWQSDLSPGTIFKTREEAQEFERVIIPRKLVSSVIDEYGSSGCVCTDYDDAIDKIVEALGELWSVQGYVKPRSG